MTDINISSVPAGMPAPGCCSGPEELGTAEARDRAPEVKRPDNVTAGRHCQTPACVLASRKVKRKQTGGRSPSNYKRPQTWRTWVVHSNDAALFSGGALRARLISPGAVADGRLRVPADVL